MFEAVAASRAILTSARAVEEVRGVAGDPRLPSSSMALAEVLIAGFGVIDEAVYADLLEAAQQALIAAVASSNVSASDAHLLACAWACDADVWSHDRDFAGTGWPSWSNANLSAAAAAYTLQENAAIAAVLRERGAE